MLKSKLSMRTLFLSGIVLSCGMAGTVQAANLGSDPVYGGPTQDHIACQVANVGNTAITFVKTVIFSQTSTSVPLTFNNCTGSLAPNRICSFQAAASNQAFACKVITNEVENGSIRGAIDALTSSNDTLSEAQLR
jgi:hypothetical protein